MYEISVIIPVYNTEKYIEKCLKSVIQSDIFEQCEVLLIDDGSTDRSTEIIEKIAKKYTNIQLHRYENEGVSAARNRGLKIARGKYIFFLDSDDILRHDYLYRLYMTAESKNCDIVFSGFSEMSEDGTSENVIYREILDQRMPMNGCRYLDLRMDYGDWYNQVWCALYKKSFLDSKSIGFDERIRIYEDIVFTNQALVQAGRVCAVVDYGYLYRIHKSSLVHGGIKERDVIAGVEALKRLTEIYEELDSEQKHSFGRVLFEQISMTLYYIGKLKLKNKKQYYQGLLGDRVLEILRVSAVTKKEWIKYLIFRYCIGLYYPLVKKKDS